MGKPDYDTTVARIAGNIASGLVARATLDRRVDVEKAVRDIAVDAVRFARAIVAEVHRTQPAASSEDREER